MAASALADELQALSSIYGDELLVLSRTAFSIRLSPQLILSFDLSSSYPHTSPVVTFDAAGSGLRKEEVERTQARGAEAWKQSEGEVCCYQVIEAIRSEVERMQEERRAEAKQEMETAFNLTHHDGGRVTNEEKQLHSGIEQHGAGDWELDDGEAVEERAEEWQQKKTAQLAARPAPAAVQGIDESSPSPFVSGPAHTDRRSVFIGHVAPLTAPSSLPSLLSYIHTHPKLSRATHNMYAYRISSLSYTQSGCDDDGEDRAGGRLLHLLEAMGVKNALVVVSRWYGGVKLGAERFRIINNVARELLEAQGYHGERKGEGGAKGRGSRKEKPPR